MLIPIVTASKESHGPLSRHSQVTVRPSAPAAPATAAGAAVAHPDPHPIVHHHAGGGRLRLILALGSLAVGSFAIGTTEFVSMGLLPQLAAGVGVSIPTAGHVISLYALGVVVGAPVLSVLGARMPRRTLLLLLMGVFLLGNLATALAQSYPQLLVARFVAGLPHGAYFGIASIVAADLVSPARRGQAVSLVMTGLSVATVVGVPAATWLGQGIGWRSAYWLVAALALITLVLVAVLVPFIPGDRTVSRTGELAALKRPQVLLALAAGAIGFGGMFALYTYIAPTVTDVAGLSEGMVPVYLLAFGLGSLLGTPLAGRLADWSVMRTMLIGSAAMGVGLVAFTVTAQWFIPGLITAFLIPIAGSLLVISLQMRLMAVAGKARALGAALNHSALNTANALGAWLGGLVIAAGFGYTATSWVGAGLSLAGFGILLVSAALERRSPTVVD